VIAGQGAGLLPAAMVALDVEERRLVRLAKPTHMETFAYYLVYPGPSHDNPKISVFRDWILSVASD
jgi:LysR family glycine cleavage system transcriptional activator